VVWLGYGAPAVEQDEKAAPPAQSKKAAKSREAKAPESEAIKEAVNANSSIS